MRATRTLSLLALLLGLPTAFGTARADAPKVDLSAWQRLPVFYVEDGAQKGRMMPLDTFAREMVELICHKQAPTIGMLNGYSTAEVKDDAKLAGADSLFEDKGNKPRRFSASELLLSWLAQPEKWEDVPFIQAKHKDLREKFGMPLDDEATKVKFTSASPRQIQQNTAFWDYVAELHERQSKAGQQQKEFQPTELDKRVLEVYKAYTAYRLLTSDPTTETERREFRMRFAKLIEPWQNLRRDVGVTPEFLAAELEQADKAFDELLALAKQGAFKASAAEGPAVAFREATAAIAERMARENQRLHDTPPKEWDAARLQEFETLFARFKQDSRKVAELAQRAHLALYDDGSPLAILPALNGPALHREREPEDDAQPWINLPTVLYGSPAVLAGFPNAQLQYPAGDVQAVRGAYADLCGAYREGRVNDVRNSAEALSAALSKLGHDIEPMRAELLPEADSDKELFAYTAYPAAGSTNAEVIYNRTQPFVWSWVIALAAVSCFALSFGLARKAMFWVGVAILAGALAWTAYGFYLRVLITGWAPVTNMYETVVYVPFVVAVLGLWFTFVPATWPGLKNAWRLTAVPGTWESTELRSEQTQLAGPGFWQWGNTLMVVPRVLLMALVFWMLTQAPYAAGDRTIINLTPNRDAGHTLPNFNDALTWAAGLLVLVPTMWFLPRLIVAALASVVMIPWTLRGHVRKALDEVYPRRVFAMSSGFLAAGLWMIASYAPVLDDKFSPLQPVLRDNFWLTIHVLTIVSSYGAGLLAFGLSMTAMGYYLFGKYRPGSGQGAMRPPEATATLAGYTYKAIQVAVLLLAAGTLLGALWADVSWGRFWGWDPKEVWALISLLVYLAILHGRYAGMFHNFGLHLGAILGATAIAFSWYGVNFWLGVGLHSYGFGEGGQYYVAGFLTAIWGLWVAPASYRYWFKCSTTLWAGSGEAEAEIVDEAREPGRGTAPSV